MKEEFVKNLEALMKSIPAFRDLASLDYVRQYGSEYLYETFTNGTQRRVNITGDSEVAIMEDYLHIDDKGEYVLINTSNYRPQFVPVDLSPVLDYLNGCSVPKDAPFDDALIQRIAIRYEMSPIELKELIYEHYLDKTIPEWAKTAQDALTEYYGTHLYCEVGFDTDDFICIICDHEPTLENLLLFCQKDMEQYKATSITSYNVLPFKDAHDMYDLEQEGTFPVCSNKPPKKTQEINRD